MVSLIRCFLNWPRHTSLSTFQLFPAKPSGQSLKPSGDDSENQFCQFTQWCQTLGNKLYVPQRQINTSQNARRIYQSSGLECCVFFPPDSQLEKANKDQKVAWETQGRCEGWIAWWAARTPHLPVQFHSVAQLWTAAGQASLSITNSWNPLKLMSIVSVMTSNHLMPCYPLLLLLSIFPSIKVFSNE